MYTIYYTHDTCIPVNIIWLHVCRHIIYHPPKKGGKPLEVEYILIPLRPVASSPAFSLRSAGAATKPLGLEGSPGRGNGGVKNGWLLRSRIIQNAYPMQRFTVSWFRFVYMTLMKAITCKIWFETLTTQALMLHTCKWWHAPLIIQNFLTEKL